MIHLALGGQLQIETRLLDRVKYFLEVLRSCLIANMRSVIKFARFCKALKGNTHNVDLQAFPYILTLSETHLYEAEAILRKY